MKIAEVLKPISIGLRSKLFVCAVTICAGYAYGYLEAPIPRFVSLCIFFISAEAMVWLWGNFFGQSVLESLKMMLTTRKMVIWVDNSAFRQLAERMGIRLHKTRPFGVRRELDNAYANPITRQVVLGEKLLGRLTSDEALALLGHELTHIIQNHFLRMMGASVLALVATMLLPIDSDMMRLLIGGAVFMIAFVFVNWGREYAADANAAKYTSAQATISLIEKLVPTDRRSRESEPHPSIDRRISKLKAISDK